MGKYMKKGRGWGVPQSHLGVRTRAMEKNENYSLSINSEDNGNSNSIGNSRSRNSSSSKKTEGFRPSVQLSYLELRSRKLEKVVVAPGAGGQGRSLTNHPRLSSQCRELSDMTNSDMLVDDCSSRLVHSEEARLTGKCSSVALPANLGRTWCVDENRGVSNCTSRGRAPPGVGHSRSNSRSNSITREFPAGILTRNRRKGMQVSAGLDEGDSSRREVFAAGNDGDSNNEVEVSYGENGFDEVLCFKESCGRIVRESTSSRQNQEAKTSFIPNCGHDHGGASSHLGLSAALSPMEVEIEEFFLQAEGQEHRRFIERYNFDPVMETPLPGHFDWVTM